jgi:hypothetical protein
MAQEDDAWYNTGLTERNVTMHLPQATYACGTMQTNLTEQEQARDVSFHSTPMGYKKGKV